MNRPAAPPRRADDTSEHAERRARLAGIVGDTGIALIAAAPERNRNNDVDYPYRPDSDFRYLTGFCEPRAIAVIAPGYAHGDYLLFCRERDIGAETWVGRRAGPEGAQARFGADRGLPIDAFDDWLPGLLDGRERLFLELGSHSEFKHDMLRRLESLRSQGRRCVPPARIVVLDDVLHAMRLRKSAGEVALMRLAAQTSARAHAAIMRAARPGLYEYQLAAVAHYEFEWDGMTWAYPTIAAAGANACVLHYIENSARIGGNDLVLVDAGAECRGYAGDITRTFPAAGRFSADQRAFYAAVLAANQAAIRACAPGARADAPHRAALRALVAGMIELGVLAGGVDEAIEAESYRAFFMHGTSHWLGMDVHDVGDYKRDGQWRTLEAGMTFTVEPGLYVPADSETAPQRYRGMGVRIEDNILITPDGCDVLTAGVPKQPDAIEAIMAEGRAAAASA